MENKEKIISKLNSMLSQEHACSIRYATHAASITGPYAEVVAERLLEISADEVSHAQMLRNRILALGGTPTMDVNTKDLVPATELAEILSINIQEEKEAIAEYTELLSIIPRENVILFQAIQDIVRDEQEHLEELQNFE